MMMNGMTGGTIIPAVVNVQLIMKPLTTQQSKKLFKRKIGSDKMEAMDSSKLRTQNKREP